MKTSPEGARVEKPRVVTNEHERGAGTCRHSSFHPLRFSPYPPPPLSGDCIAGISGRLGGRVYYLWNDRQCVRTHVMPANPRTERQQQGRARFAGLVARWRSLGAAHKERWNRRAKRLNMSGYNLFISVNMKKQGARRENRLLSSPARLRTHPEKKPGTLPDRAIFSHPYKSPYHYTGKRPVILSISSISRRRKILHRQTDFQVWFCPFSVSCTNNSQLF